MGSLLVGYHLQQAMDSTALQAEQELVAHQWPKPLKNVGKVKVWVHTAQGLAVPVWVTYYRRKGPRRADKRYAGVYAGLVVLGIYDRCTQALAAEVSLLAARSYWIPGSSAPALSEKRNAFLRLLKNKGFKEESMTKVRWYTLGTSTTLESNKSH